MAGITDDVTFTGEVKQTLNRIRHSIKLEKDVLTPLITAINSRSIKTVAVAVTGATTDVDVGEDITTLYGVIITAGGVVDVAGTNVTAAAINGTTASQVDFTGTPGGAGYAIVMYD